MAAALANRLADVAGIRAAYDYLPDSIPLVPAAVIGFGPLSYTQTSGGGLTQAELPVLLLVNRPNEASSQRLLRRLLSFAPIEGDEPAAHVSIAAAIAHDRTLDGTCAACHIDPDAPAGGIEVIDIGSTKYLATSLTIRAHS